MLTPPRPSSPWWTNTPWLRQPQLVVDEYHDAARRQQPRGSYLEVSESLIVDQFIGLSQTGETNSSLLQYIACNLASRVFWILEQFSFFHECFLIKTVGRILTLLSEQGGRSETSIHSGHSRYVWESIFRGRVLLAARFVTWNSPGRRTPIMRAYRIRQPHDGISKTTSKVNSQHTRRVPFLIQRKHKKKSSWRVLTWGKIHKLKTKAHTKFRLMHHTVARASCLMVRSSLFRLQAQGSNHLLKGSFGHLLRA